jgi:hypothetical protein
MLRLPLIRQTDWSKSIKDHWSFFEFYPETVRRSPVFDGLIDPNAKSYPNP